MKEATRIYSRLIPNFLLAAVSVVAWFRFGDVGWLLIGACSGALGLLGLAQSRSAGDAPAPPLANPRLVKRLAIVCGAAGSLVLLAMLWRIGGQWARLGEPANLWLGAACVTLLGIACFAPVELRRARSAGSN